MNNPTFETVQALIREHGPEAAERILTAPTVRRCKPGRANAPGDMNDIFTAHPMSGPGVADCFGGTYTRPVFGGRG